MRAHPVGHLRGVVAHQVVQDRRGAGDRADGDVDRALGLEPAGQLVVVDDLAHVGGVDRGGQLGGVVGVDDHARLVGLDVGDDPRLRHVPALQHEGGLGVGLAQQHRLGLACP